MKRVSVVRRKVALPLLVTTLFFIPISNAQAADPAPAGVLWQTTSQMSMPGMPMSIPAQKVKVCTRADAAEPPGSANDERGCVNSDFQRDGQTVTWQSECTGPPAMTGQGTITYSAEGDAYEGTLNYVSDGRNIVIALTGARLPEPCANPR